MNCLKDYSVRFRAESSADSIKSSYIMITLAISLLGLLLI